MVVTDTIAYLTTRQPTTPAFTASPVLTLRHAPFDQQRMRHSSLVLDAFDRLHGQHAVAQIGQRIGAALTQGERLTVNIGIVLVFAAFYLRFLRRP